MSRKYIDDIKKLIEHEANQCAVDERVTLDFISSTYDAIKKKIRVMEEVIWAIPKIDEETLLSFFEIAKKEYLSTHPIKMEASSSLTKPGFRTWLTPQRKEKIDWNYTDRYLQFLDLAGRSEGVIRETSQSSMNIAEKLGDPISDSAFFTKGLVVGEVQSGKTANFNALINRAFDCGYQLVIVLSGITEDLREQTQDRLELEVVGEGRLSDSDSDLDGIKGVGELIRFGNQGVENIQQIESITSTSTDFTKGVLETKPALNSPKILVCKKNVAILRNLINWLADSRNGEDGRHSVPLLIIDDEADNASLNNEGAKGREYASKINGHIRAILSMFHKKSYLGYTASPFANVLQDRNDPADNRWPVMSDDGERKFEQVDNLFPEDFIVLLESASNYIGAKQIFETISDAPKLPVVSATSDHEVEFPSRVLKTDSSPVVNFPTQNGWNDWVAQHGSYLGFSDWGQYKKNTRASRRDDNFPQMLPKSMREAILCFILSTAVRESRKSVQRGSSIYQPHNTMLVHISRFTTWQNKTSSLIDEYLKSVKSRVENDSQTGDGSIFIEFEDLWNQYFSNIITNIKEYLPERYDDGFMTPIIFKAVSRFIPIATEGIDILAINSVKGHKLKYKKSNPRKIIAVGGNRLSRGFTIEGLTINYFVRTTNYSDTLLQMGRWFGYRPGYLDCCRIFTTRDSIEKFNSTTRCIEELEHEFKKMRDLGKSPNNFLLRVRKHPGVLQITRPSILKKTATVKWSYQDQLEMTTKFDVRRNKIENVWEAFKSEISPIFSGPSSGVHDDSFFRAELRGEKFLDFLKIENNFDEITLDTMRRFIELCQDKKKLINWTIAVKRTGKSNQVLGPEFTGLPDKTKLTIRNGPSKKSNPDHRDLFLKKHTFRASGGSANIVSSNKDLAITLSDQEIVEAEREFRDQRKNGLMRDGMSEEEAIRESQRMPKTIPERVYREKISEQNGVLIIYLFDSNHSFNQVKKKGEDRDSEFDDYVEVGKYDLSVPIVGYAIGFPPIKDDPGGSYVHGDYDLQSDEGSEDDIDPEGDDFLVPDDEGDA
jgi:hypothetical protein